MLIYSSILIVSIASIRYNEAILKVQLRDKQMKNTLLKNILQIVLLLGLITFAFWFALKDNVHAILNLLLKASFPYVILLVLMGISYYLLQGYLLSYTARRYDKNIRIADGVENAYVAAFFNGVTPLGGGQVAQTYAFRKLGISYSNIASILWKDFFLYQSVVVVFASILILTNLSYAFATFPTFVWLILLGLAINTSVIFFLLTMSLFPKLYAKLSSWLVVLLAHIRVVKNKELTLKKLDAQVLYFAKEINLLKKDHKLIVKGVLLNVVRQVIYYSIPFVAGLCLGLPLPLQDYFITVLLACFIHMLNALTPLPGDTGWTETAFVILFAVVFQKVNASAIMILWRASTYYVSVLIGGLVFLRVKMKKRHT